MQIIKWILSTVLLLLPTYTSQEVEYECGAHGRFEYCIDGIPGCVIGCHCHPGYYFDTDSKICEPNSKLSQQYRRNHLSEPTRVQISQASEETIPTSTTTTINPIDKKVEEITKDADDLGDWLYNQFFKTIENQVINKTDRGDLITRRSGRNTQNKKSKHKTRKSWKKKRSSKKKKNKKGNLRSKLLRITEDDSLFDSSGSNSDGESSSGSDSGSSESESSSSDDDKDSSSTTTKKKKKSHGHKKFLFFNKVPKPPLPSFIFLPNMGTPFFPPVGLPPPPVPMYPMVPVPPMGPVFPEFTVKCSEENEKTDATSTTTSTVTPETKPDTITTTESETSTETPATIPSLRKRGRKMHARNKPWGNGMVKENTNNEIIEAQNAMLQKIQERLKIRNKKEELNDLMEQMQQGETPLLDDNAPGDSFSYLNQLKPDIFRKQLQLQQPISEGTQNTEDVGFKYLSDLIHRVDLNNTNLQPETPKIISDRMPIPPVPQRRQNYNAFLSPRQSPPSIDGRRALKQHNGQEDLYYTDLGRQIASLIRKIDSNGSRQINIDIEKTGNTPAEQVFLENMYAPRSYWERSIRSPLKYHQPNKYQYLQKSNENLFNLESKVQIFATTKPALSLNDLENIINTMNNKKTDIKIGMYDNMGDKTSNISLNINLLPKNENANVDNKIFLQEKYTTEPQKSNEHVKSNPTKYFKLNMIHSKLQGTITNPQVNITKGNDKIDLKEFNQNDKPIRRIFEVLKKYQIPHKSIDRNIYKWSIQPATKRPFINHQYNNFNQHQQYSKQIANKNTQYTYEHASYRIPKKINKYFAPFIKPSFFHHQLHHFDYFD